MISAHSCDKDIATRIYEPRYVPIFYLYGFILTVVTLFSAPESFP